MKIPLSLLAGEKFDVIFIDADKENYIEYYKMAMEGLLSSKGFILADNSMCALLYDSTDIRSKKLHEFNQYVKNDKRVEQVILTIREGITMIKPIIYWNEFYLILTSENKLLLCIHDIYESLISIYSGLQ